MEQTISQTRILHASLKQQTLAAFQIIDITDEVQAFVEQSQIKSGQISVFTKHTTTAIKINEKEDGFFNDFKKFCQEFMPASKTYCHNDLSVRDPATMCEGEECANGHSHLLQMFIGSASETVPVIDGKLSLGRWQRILFIELDHGRERELNMTLIGA